MKSREKPSLGRRLLRVAQEEAAGYDLHRWLLNVLPRLFPLGSGGRLRAAFYRILGLPIGSSTLIAGPLTFGAGRGLARRVSIGSRCFINSHVYIDPVALVSIGDGVSIGHHVVIITSCHEIGPPVLRAGSLLPHPVVIGSGAWVAAGVTILPGVTIGAGAVIAAGALVNRDVPPHTLVGGVPARFIRSLPEEEGQRCR